jgi:hypothetical protein
MERGAGDRLDAGTLPVNPFCETEGGIVTLTDCPADAPACAQAIDTERKVEKENVKDRLLRDLRCMMGNSGTTFKDRHTGARRARHI